MRIAIFSTTMPEPGRKIGGVESAVHKLANTLASNGQDEVTVFSLGPRPADAHYFYKQLFVNAQWLRNKKVARLYLLPFLLNLVNFEEEFDVLHLHGDDWFFFRRSLPTVRTLHGSALNEARSATSLKRKVSQYLVYPLEYLSARLTTIPVAVGKDTQEIYGIERSVDNGVNLDLFCPGDKSTVPSILFVGTWQGRKRGEFIFSEFVNRILPEFPNLRLYMVSDICPPHPNVVDMRFPDDETLAQLFREAWVFAYPSVYEGFGIPYIEALASGTAIVATNNNGAKYVLNDGEYGIIAHDALFSNYVLEVLRDSEKRNMLETKGISRAKEFSWDIVAGQHREVYSDAIAKFRKYL